MEFPVSPHTQRERRNMASFLSEKMGRAALLRIPYRVGQVLIGDDPFIGPHLGTVAVIESPYVGLRTPGSPQDDVVFYDFRQLRRAE